MKYDDPIIYNGNKLTDKYIASLNKEERQRLIDPLTDIFYNMGYQYPDDYKKVDKEWKRIIDYEADITTDEIYNNDSVGTYISKFFCKDFYTSKSGKNKRTLVNIFEDKELVRKIVENRLGIGWYEEVSGTDGTFSISPKMIFWQGPRSMRLTNQQSIFKPIVYKHLVKKYSNSGDKIFDYSCGWGARMLATASFGDRKYIGVDPLTVSDLIKMKEYLKLDRIKLFNIGSEEYEGEEDSIDFAASSPPYFNQEIYSDNLNQAYNHGEDYFYNIYWAKTLKNVKKMLKTGRWFGLNVVNYPKMVEMAREEFGQEIEIIKLKTTKSHLAHKNISGNVKFEPIYMFKKT